MQTPQRFGKIALQKALKERLVVLTQSLAEAEKGQKGIELVKEMKELHSMLESMNDEKLRDNKKKESPQYHIFTWGPVQVLPNTAPHNSEEPLCPKALPQESSQESASHAVDNTVLIYEQGHSKEKQNMLQKDFPQGNIYETV